VREAKMKRQTTETNIQLSLNVDGTGNSQIDTGIGFFNHMLTLFSSHGFFDLQVKCEGDLDVDYHHTVEDVGIVLGKLFQEALGDKKGITRYATEHSPMDEALSMVSLDISGRSYLRFNVEMPVERVGQFDTELVEEFFRAFAHQAGITLHINLLYGKNGHHIIESIFKGVGRALDQATQKQERIKGVRSTKGML
jgi:imidazoleglycerol-phosphate dehydratase